MLKYCEKLKDKEYFENTILVGDIDSFSSDSSLEERIEQKDEIRYEIRRLFNKLTKYEIQILKLRYLESKSIEETANILHLDPVKVKNLVYEIRNRIHEEGL